MRLGDERPSDNIEDRRGGEGFGLPRGGPGFRVPIGARRGGGLGIGGLILLLGIAWLMGVNPLDVLVGGGVGVPGDQPYERSEVPQQQGRISPAEDELKDFTARVLGSTERAWQRLFEAKGRRYEEPRLVLFSGYVQSACGMAQSATGPFYCPRDSKVYIDLSFYQDLRNKLGSPGDFAQAYVIAHEVGHHVQNLQGLAEKVAARRMQVSREEANQLSVRMELQADCYAGVWAKNADEAGRILEKGDIEEGINAASAIGDDRLQKRSQGYVVPESFTHGSSEQRVRWFTRGLQSGDMDTCNTFQTDSL